MPSAAVRDLARATARRQAQKRRSEVKDAKGDADRAPRPAPSQTRDTKGASDRDRATRFQRTAPARKAAQEVYAAQPLQRRKEITRASRDAGKGTAGDAVRAEHRARGKFDRTPRGKAHAADIASKRALLDALAGAERPRLLDRVTQRQTSGIPGRLLGAIGNELEGKGKLASILSSVGSTVAEHVNPEGGYPGAARGVPGSKEITQNTVKDLINLPAQVVPSLYLPAKEVAKGRPDKAAEMLVEPIVATAKDPVGSFQEHPLNTALMASGAKAVVTRPAGALLHLAGKGERAPKTLPGTNLEERRTYSRDALTMAGQKAADVARGRRADRIERMADDDRVPEARRTELMRKAQTVRGQTMTTREVQRRVDERVSANEDVRRANRGRVLTDVDKIVGRKGGARSAPTVLVAQNIVKPEPAAMRMYVDELKAAYPLLSRSGRRANRELRRRLNLALRNPRTSWGEIEVAARRYAEYSRPMQDALVERGLLSREQADRAALIPYAVMSMGARHDGERIVGADGAELPTAAVREHMKANRTSEPAFLTQAPNGRGARNFYVAADRDPRASSSRRTGEATRHGTFDASPLVLREQAARAQGLADAADSFRSFVDEFGVRHASGKVKAVPTFKAAQKAADELTATTGGATVYRPVRLSAFGTRREQTEALLEQTAREPRTLDAAIEEALGAEGGSGPWAIVPQAAADRLRDHLRVGSSPLGKVGDLYGSQFRKVVLSTSPKWMAGNVAEAGLRSLISRSGPRSYATGRRVLAELDRIDPKAGRELQARATSGGHYSLGRRASVHRNAEHFAGTRLEPIAQALGKVARTPGPKQAVGLWNAWTHLVMDSLNGRLETHTQTAMLGTALRRSPLMHRHALKLGNTAVREAAEGLRNTNAQVQFAREVDWMYGRYSKWSPGMRRAIASYTPFAAWWLNSVRFVYRTLPQDHPVLTGLLASANTASEEWRESIGQEFGSDLPDYLWGSIPTEGGGWRRISELTPFGVTTNAAGPPGKFPSLVLPQAAGVFAALEGTDWRGRDLETDDGRKYNGIERAAFAARELVSGTVPLLAQGLRASEREGSALQKILEELNPVRATKGKANGSGWGSALSQSQVDEVWGASESEGWGAATPSGWGK